MQKNRVSNQKDFLNYILEILMACSFAALSFYLLVGYAKVDVAITVVTAWILAFFFVNKTKEETWRFFLSHKKLCGCLLLCSVLLMNTMHQQKVEMMMAHPQMLFSFQISFRLLSLPAMIYFFIWTVREVSQFLLRFAADLKLSKAAKKALLFFVGFLAVGLLALYAGNSVWYQQSDLVYSMDTRWVLEGICQDSLYFDIRHPVLGVIVTPVCLVISSILGFFFSGEWHTLLVAASIQTINVCLLIFIGLTIMRLSQNKWVFWLYMVSFPTILFSVVLEKFQVCTFLLVVYLYMLSSHSKRTEIPLIMAIGAMPTSVFIYLNELLIHEPLSDKIKRAVRYGIFGVLFLICTGRANLLNLWELYDSVDGMTKIFGAERNSIKELLYSFLNMIHGCFLALPSIQNHGYTWQNILENVSCFSVILLAVVLLGAVVGRKEQFIRACTVWLAFAAVFIFVLRWSVHESPLFSIYFSWALIPLFQRGIQFLIDRLHLPERISYSFLLLAMLAVNVAQMVNIGIFLRGVEA